VSLGKIRTGSLKVLVLDEADRLFANETEELARTLLKSAPSSCTRVLVSATIPERVRREMRPLLRDAAEICPEGETVMSGSIEHWCFYCDGRKRLDFARRFEAALHPDKCLMFLSMATRVEKAALALAALGLPVGAIHSGMDKETRRVALERFSKGELRYLLTSDLGARGLDIPGITHVLSLDLPEEPTVYTHRAGRTGRAGATGVSMVLADGVELARASKIATKGGFVFRCKVLEEGQVLEPTSEEFFARATSAEQQRMSAKAANDLERNEPGDERRGSGFRRRDSGEGRASPRREDGERRPPRRDAHEAGGGRREESGRRGPRPEESPEAPRTARAPRSAPWRESSEEPSRAPHRILQKKGDLPASPPPQPPVSRNAPVSERQRHDRPRTERPRGDGPGSDRPHSDRPRSDRPRSDRPRSDRPRTERPRGAGPGSDRPRSDRPRTERPRGAGPGSDRPRRESAPRSKRPPKA
jgi:ATP-dependent RNA helicase RhlE